MMKVLHLASFVPWSKTAYVLVVDCGYRGFDSLPGVGHFPTGSSRSCGHVHNSVHQTYKRKQTLSE